MNGLISTFVSGSYAICLDNTHSMMNSKLVYVYYVTFVPEEWQKYHEEISDLRITVGNFSVSSVTDCLVSIWPASCEKGPSDITNSVDADQPLHDFENSYT